MSYTILGALNWWARDMPDCVALNVDGSSVTYGELHGWSRAIAARLVALGIAPGDRIGLLGTQSLPYFALALAMQHIGAIAVPLNIRFTPRELHIAIEDTTPRMLFAEASCHALGHEALTEHDVAFHDLAEVEDWRAPPSAPFAFTPQRDTLIAIMSTSGSTAKPKFVKFNHDMVVSIALELQLIEPSVHNGRAMLVAPPFSGGLYTTFEYLVLGCSVFLQSRFDPEVAIDLIARERISVMPSSPVFLERIAASPRFETLDMSSIRWATVGGARVPEPLVKLYRDKGVMLRCLFGQTEAGAAWAATGAALDNAMQAGFGGPFTDWGVMQDGEMLPPGEKGEIVLRSASVTPGYWQDDESTARTLRDGWLHTGDVGIMDARGSLTFLDRMKDIIISGGLNISPAEVEAVIGDFAGVEEVAVIAAADAKFGETPMAIIHGSATIDPRQIIAHCDRNLANYKVPRYIAIEPEPLPRLATGKIAKPLLRQKYHDAAERLPRLR